MPTPKLNAEIIAAAIEGFESQKRRIDTQIGELRAMLSGGRTEGTATPEAPTRKRKVSAAARRRMAEGQKEKMGSNKGGISRAGIGHTGTRKTQAEDECRNAEATT